MIELSSASDSCVSAVTCRRRFPARYTNSANTGTITSDSSVNCHDRITIATNPAVNPATSAITDGAAPVTTPWIPPTSFANRDCNSPVRAVV